MVVKNLVVGVDSPTLTCDVCNSDEIAETIEGYMCRNCGIVHTITKLQFDIPFKEEAVQNSKGLGITQIGTNRERETSPQSWLLYRLNKQNLIVENKRDAEIRAEKAIYTILELLRISKSFVEGIFMKFKEIWPQLYPGSRYRNPEKLVAITMYYYLKLQNIVIDKDELVDVSEISRDEFRNFQLQILQYFPEYKLRERREFISKKLLRIREQFNLDMKFYTLSKTILDKFWRFINNTKDDVVAGLCASISVLCAFKDKVSTHKVCKFLNIRMSTIQLQVKGKICKRFKISGFTTLVKSSGLLRVFLREIGLLTNIEFDKNEKPIKVIKVELKGACKVFKPLNDHYLFEFISENQNSLIGYLEVDYDQLKSDDNKQIIRIVKLDVILGFIYPNKDPPSITLIERRN